MYVGRACKNKNYQFSKLFIMLLASQLKFYTVGVEFAQHITELVHDNDSYEAPDTEVVVSCSGQNIISNEGILCRIFL